MEVDDVEREREEMGHVRRRVALSLACDRVSDSALVQSSPSSKSNFAY